MDRLWMRMVLFILPLFFITVANAGSVKGIYVTQYNFENTSFLKYLIKNAKSVGIDTFVVDLELLGGKRYRNNVQLLKENGINYVARIIVFPDGGTVQAIKTPAIWQKKYKLVQQAVEMGAKEIQLDYIRYRSAQKASTENAKDILTIIQWYKSKLAEHNVPLQIDVFGVTSFGESKHIGQNIKLFSESVDAICPMVYPSHYWPYQKYYKIPYETVYQSLTRIKKQFGDETPMKVYAYIELSNYHYPRMSRDQKLVYIKAQLKAVHHAGADGWFAWSPHNRYENLFALLRNGHSNVVDEKEIAADASEERTENIEKKIVKAEQKEDLPAVKTVLESAEVVAEKNPSIQKRPTSLMEWFAK